MRRDPERRTWERRGDAEDEVRSHIEALEERLLEEGLDPEEAAREARRRFGDRDSIVRECRAIDRRLDRRERRSDVLADLAMDLRLALRRLAAAPGFTLGAVLTMALAIGATTALFSVVHGVLLQPLPYEGAERLAILSSQNQERGWDDMPLPQGVWDQLADGAAPFDLAVWRPHRATLLSSLEPRRLAAAAVSEDLFGLLGVTPVVGRTFLPSDGSGSPGDPCLVSEELWRTALSGDESALGETLRLEGDLPPCTVVGVLPAGVDFPDAANDLWTLFRIDRSEDLWGSWFLRGIVRIDDGAGIDGARRELDALAETWASEFPFGDGWSFELTPLRSTVVGDVEAALWVLLAAVAIVLLIACVNLGGVLLARTAQRRSELAVRAALGATRSRLARQLLAENLLLCVAGGALGVALAHLALRAFTSRPPIRLPRLDEVALHPAVLGFALVATLASALLSWLAPLTSALRGGLASAHRRHHTDAPASMRTGSWLVVIESALAVVLLVGAGLLARSFVTLTSVDPGFDPGLATSVRIELPPSRYDDEIARRAFFAELLERVGGLQSVSSAGLTTGLPLHGVAMIDRLQVADQPVPEEERAEVAIDAVSPGYFETLGVPVLAGRTFDSRDGEDGPRVAVVNAELAHRVFGSLDVLGRRIVARDDETEVEIVGVVGAVKQYGVRKDTPLAYYVPFAQDPRGTAHLVVRTPVNEELLAADLRTTIADLDAALPVTGVTSLERVLRRSLDRDRFYAIAMGSFAGLAALLATLGLYGVVATTVARRRREVGVRMALGATRRSVFRSVLGRGLALGAAGVALGLLAAFGLVRSLSGLLYQVQPYDLVAFAASAALILLTAAGASGLPARRAVGVDPAQALRND